AFSLTNSTSLTLNSVTTFNGQIFVQSAGGAMSVVDNSLIYATGGTLSLNNQSTASGTIAIGKNVAILDQNSSGSLISITLGTQQTASTTKAPKNVSVATSAGGTVSFTASGISASQPTSLVSAKGSTTQVVFDTGGASSSSAISLGGGDLIAASNGTQLQSLDLTDPAVVAAVVAQQQNGLLGGHLTVDVNGVVTGGSLVLTPVDITRTVTAFNAPGGVTINLVNFLSTLPVN